ncbi:hypothetical protein H6F78_24895 [Coleofasciculus sp. FACHB-64]|uniref:hypothetical protein n=1 Tax=Cyanophyceae TaxID=3028117 RepID=UPI00168719D9|nr:MULTISPECIES: hypothetical protein [unclassified Coleofasciculus]MBD1838723.1 hypothetical protein [Coleofasciculus sp. FACHB-501]MBD2048795.1 hypothetical protein [Coleofasciculus sp. FACHB-64]
MKRSYRASESLIRSLPTLTASLATLQSAAVTAVWALAFCFMSAIAHSLPPNFDRIACHASMCCCNCCVGDRIFPDSAIAFNPAWERQNSSVEGEES